MLCFGSHGVTGNDGSGETVSLDPPSPALKLHTEAGDHGRMENVPAAYADIDWEGLTDARRALIGNPYATPLEDVDSATAWFFGHKEDVPRAMFALCEMKKPSDARKLALAAAHAYVRVGSLSLRVRPICAALNSLRDEHVRLEPEELTRLSSALERFHAVASGMVGTSSAMRQLLEEVWTLCFGPNLYESLRFEGPLRKTNVLLLGETGTGKERVAEMIQAGSFSRTDSPFIAINCAALPKDLAEVELFGAERGAHSAAHQRRDGKIFAADRGTLFLDEVADLPSDVQAKLLSTMSNGYLTPLGTNERRSVDVRYVAATSRPLLEMVKAGSFREDLYQRLAGRVVTIPPLRSRPEDVVAIGIHILKVLRAGPGAPPGFIDLSSDIGAAYRVGDDDLEWLRTDATKLPWPGNVRELEAALRQRVLGLRPQSGLDIHLRGPAGEQLDVPERILRCAAPESEVIEWYMRRVIERTSGNLSEAQRILGVDRSTIRRRLERIAIAPLPDDA